MDSNFFWTVFKADLLFSLCSITLTVIVTLVFTKYRKKKLKKEMKALDDNAPRAFMIGGKEPKPGHCPLCGHEWPLPGPILQEKKEETKV